MSTDALAELRREWRYFSVAGISLNLTTVYPLEAGPIPQAVVKLSNALDLPDKRYDTEKSKHSARDVSGDFDKHVIFNLNGLKDFEFIMGMNARADFESTVRTLVACYEDDFRVMPELVEMFDIQYHVFSEWAGHHYRAISEAFLAAGPLGDVFEEKNLLQDDLVLRGLVADDRDRVYVINITSNVADREVSEQNFSNDKLRVSAGCGQVSSIDTHARLADSFWTHVQTALTFMGDKFIPLVLDPLDKAIASLAEEGNNGCADS